MIAICQMTLTFARNPVLSVWFFLALYEIRSLKNFGQVYVCKVYWELHLSS